jgi:TetR/AcrR family transcriptional repressor of nem operon
MSLREIIIHGAQKSFSLNGFLNTGVKEIIEVAGTSKGRFYNHFASKEELSLVVFTKSQKIWRKKVFHSIQNIESPTKKIIQILNNYRYRYLKNTENFPGGRIFITFSVDLDDTRPHLVQEVHKGFVEFKVVLKELIEDAVASGELPCDLNINCIGEMLFTGILGASALWCK